MNREKSEKPPTAGDPPDPIGGLLRRLRLTLIYVTAVPLLALSAFILRYVPSGAPDIGWAAAILVAMMVLMLAGMRMILRLAAAVAPAARRDEAKAPSPQPYLAREQPAPGGRSTRHTVAETAARIGALPAEGGGGSVPIATDMSESGRVEECLGMFRELMNRSGECLFIFDMETGRFLYANDTTCAFTGYGRDELLVMRVHDVDLSVTTPWEPGHERALRAERALLVREGLIRKKDGTTSPAEVCSSIMPLAGGEYLVATMRDITRRKQAEVAVLHLRNQLTHVSRVASFGVLVASIAHEVNQPLAAILNNAQAGVKLLEGTPPDISEVRSALQDIIVDDCRAGEVIRKLRSTLKKANHEWRALDINRIVVEVVSLVRRESITRGIIITRDLAPGLTPVRGDDIQLQQVMLNLLLNAFEAMEKAAGATRGILVRTAPEGSEGVRVSVCDSGHGIRAEDMPFLFEPFFTTKPDGLGMGLPINATIIEAHAGRLWAENNPGRGATFHVVLPAAKEGL